MDGKLGLARFGGCMKVDNVQALAAHLSTEIPQRYVRPEREEDIIVFNGDEDEDSGGDDIPVVDFGRLFDPEFSEDEAARLHFACKEWGFFHLINHGVAEVVIERVKQDIEKFFKFPLEEKNNVAQTPDSLEGYGQAFIHSEEQKLDWADMLFLAVFPPAFQQLRFWPANPPSCRETIDKYAIEVKKVSDDIAKVIFKNLGEESGKIYEMFRCGLQSMRFNYYPPCPCPEKVIGLSPHSDAVGLTLLLQLNELHGLQIRRNGGWITVKPLPGAFVVNVGDIIEILSNGKYKSIEHRAVVNNEKERLSVATFHSLNFGDMVGPIPETVKGGKLLYKSLEFEEFTKMFYASKLEGKNAVERMKLFE